LTLKLFKENETVTCLAWLRHFNEKWWG